MDDKFVVMAVRALAGHQAIGLYELFRLFGGQGDPDLMPWVVRRNLCELLEELGYRERFVAEVGGDGGGLMWVRSPWPIDLPVLMAADKVETFKRL